MDDRTDFEGRLGRALDEVAGPVRRVDAARIAHEAAIAGTTSSRWTDRRPRWLAPAVAAGIAIVALAGVVGLRHTTDVLHGPAGSPGSSPVQDPRAPWFLFEGGGPGRAMLYIGRSDGSDVREVARDAEITGARWSPDGTRIGYGSVGGGWTIVDVRDGTVRRIPMASSECGGPAWSADGTVLAAFIDPCANLERDTGPYVELSLERADGTGALRLRRTPGTPFPDVWEGGQWQAPGPIAWSPDGERIAFACRDDLDRTIRGLCVATVDAAAIAAGTFSPVRLDTADAVPADWAWTDMAWSPDGQWLVAAPLGTPPAPIPARQGRSVRQGKLVVVPVAGGPAVVLTEGDEGPAPGRPQRPAWSPDGDAVLYYTYRNAHLPHGASWSIDVGGGSPRQLGIPVGWTCPLAPSPDGTLVLELGFYDDGVVLIGSPDEAPPRSYVSPGASEDGTGSDCPTWQPRDVPIGAALPVASPMPVFSAEDPRDVPEGM